MLCKPLAILLLPALLLLSGCDQRVSLSSPTLSKLGGNMQEEMETALVQSGSWNMPPAAKPTGESVSPLNPILTPW